MLDEEEIERRRRVLENWMRETIAVLRGRKKGRVLP